MEQIISLFPERIAYAISNTVLHSFWQITLISIIYFITVKLKSKPSAQFKYKAALISLFFSLGCTIISFIYFYASSVGHVIAEEFATISTISFSSHLQQSGTFSLKTFLIQNQSSIAALWLCGTLLLLARFMTGILKIAALKSSAKPSTDKRLSYITNTIAAKLNINKLVEIKESTLVHTPMVLGHIKPIILFPVSVSTQLSMNEIEAILAHELAHVMRNDFIVNLLQSITEVVLYFHPCIWWLSSIVRNERENCCDDIALHFIEDKFSYAKSLVKLQELQIQTIPNFAMAFSKSNHHLKNRIMRILNQSNPSSFLREKLIAIALLFTFVLSFANNSTKDISEVSEVDCDLEDVLAKEEFSNISYSLVLEDDTIPEKNALIIKKKNKSESIDVKMVDGEITEMRIDGEIIPEDRYEEYNDRIKIDADKGISITNPNPNFDFDEDRIFSKGSSFIFSDGDNLMNFNDTNHFNMDSLGDSSSFDEMMEGLGLMEENQENHLRELSKHMESMDSTLALRFEQHVSPFGGENNKMFKHYKFNSPNNLRGNNSDAFPFSHAKNNLKSKMTRELAEDEFLKTGENKVELSGKQMKINGEKQPSNIWNKYKKLYERYVGAELNKDSKIVLEIDYDGKRNRIFKSI